MSANGQASSDVGTKTPASEKKEKRLIEMDLTNASRGIWLVKVPKYIADRWEAVEDQTDVGTLHINRQPGRNPRVTFSLSDQVVKARNESSSSNLKGTFKELPKEHTFVMGSVAAQTLTVFSQVSSTSDEVLPGPDSLKLEGQVVQKAECRPVNDKVYMNLKMEAIKKAIEPTRKTVQLDKVVNAYKPTSIHMESKLNEQRKKAEGKKSRDDKEKVMEIIFSLFEKHQYYNIKDLVKETRQPITYLKEILKEVCHYNLKNPHRNMWELKPEYRHYKSEEKKEEAEENKSSSSDDDD